MKKLQNNYHVAVPTAFNNDESLNIEVTFQHIFNLYEKGIRSVLICGSTGEQHSLSLEEKLQLVSSVENEERFPLDLEIIFGVSSIRLVDALSLAIAVNKVEKIKAVLLGYPPYIVPTQEEAMYYTIALIEQLENKAIILYNNPRRTGFDLSVKSILQLVERDNIIGIKETGDKEKVYQISENTTKKFLIFAGGDFDLEEKIKIGYNGLSSIAGNIYPQEIEAYFKLLRTGAVSQVTITEMEERLKTVLADSPISRMKALISKEEEIAMGRCRLPLGVIDK